MRLILQCYTGHFGQKRADLIQMELILLSHMLQCKEIKVIVTEIEVEILVETSVLKSPELKKVFFKMSDCMQRWKENSWIDFHQNIYQLGQYEKGF